MHIRQHHDIFHTQSKHLGVRTLLKEERFKIDGHDSFSQVFGDLE